MPINIPIRVLDCFEFIIPLKWALGLRERNRWGSTVQDAVSSPPRSSTCCREWRWTCDGILISTSQYYGDHLHICSWFWPHLAKRRNWGCFSQLTTCLLEDCPEWSTKGSTQETKWFVYFWTKKLYHHHELYLWSSGRRWGRLVTLTTSTLTLPT